MKAQRPTSHVWVIHEGVVVWVFMFEQYAINFRQYTVILAVISCLGSTVIAICECKTREFQRHGVSAWNITWSFNYRPLCVIPGSRCAPWMCSGTQGGHGAVIYHHHGGTGQTVMALPSRAPRKDHGGVQGAGTQGGHGMEQLLGGIRAALGRL